MTLTHRRQDLLRWSAIGLASALIAGALVSWFVASWLIAPHPGVIGKPPADLPATTISVQSNSGVLLSGWHIPGEIGRGAVVLLHPKHGSRRSMLSRARMLRAAGYSIVMIDFRGHGESPGEEITFGDLERHDARAAVEFARQAHPTEPIAVVGASLGGSAALMGSPLGIEALVLESVFPTITDAVRNRVVEIIGPLAYVPTKLLLVQLEPRLGIAASDFRPIDRLPETNCPVLIIAGTEDPRTTVAETREMFAAANEPKELWLVPGAAHSDFHDVSTDEYETRVLRFLQRHM